MLQLRCFIDGRERRFPLLGREVRLGRGSESDVVLSDFSVSRRHAVLRREGEGWVIHDLGSTNGVQLNGVPVERAAVRPGDQLRVGTFDLTVESEGERREEPQTDPLPAPDEAGVIPATDLSPDLASATIVRPLKEFTGAADAARATADEAALGYLTRLAALLISTASLPEVLERVMDIAFEALRVDRGFILLPDEEGGEPVCQLARQGGEVEHRPRGRVPVSRTIVETVMRDRVALMTYDALSDRRLQGGESIRMHQIRSAICAPLWSGEKIIGFMQVDSPIHVGTFGERDLDFLTALANYAAVAVERVRYAERLERERRLRGRLERYHSPAVIEEVLREGGEEAGEVRRLKTVEATVLFADLVGFTAFCESAAAQDVAELLEEYFTCCVEAIFAAGGTLDKFIGDCVMAFFGAPLPQADHARRGVEAAVAMQGELRAWGERRAAAGRRPMRARVALNSGPVVVGDIGSQRRVDYTVLGNTVNVAARLEAFVAEPGGVVLGPETRRLVGGAFPVESLGELQLKGLQQRVEAFRVRLEELA